MLYMCVAQRGTWDAEESTITFVYADGENEDKPATLLMEANGHVLIRQSVLDAWNAFIGEKASSVAFRDLIRVRVRSTEAATSDSKKLRLVIAKEAPFEGYRMFGETGRHPLWVLIRRARGGVGSEGEPYG